jgi:DNA ligase (NAD+)
MNDEKIQKKYLEKIKKITKLSKYYYNESKPLVTDQKFDELKNEIILLEKKYSYLSHKNSPSNSIGFKPSKTFKKVEHKIPMLSLGNAFTEEDLINFEKRILNYLNKDNNFNIEYVAEPKIDEYLLLFFIKMVNSFQDYQGAMVKQVRT